MKTALERQFRSNRTLPAPQSDRTAEGRHTPHRQPTEFWVRTLADGATDARQTARVLTRCPRSPEMQEQIVAVLQNLPDDELLQFLDGLCRLGPGNRYARQLGLQVLVSHARFAELATQYQPQLAGTLRDLLGTRTWTAVRRHLKAPSATGDRLLHAHVLRLAADAEIARDALCLLAGVGNDASQSVQRLALILRWLRKADRGSADPRNIALRQYAPGVISRV